MRRWVLIPVDDPDVTHVHAEIAIHSEYEVEFRGEAEFPVPSDDQPTRAIAALCLYAEANYRTARLPAVEKMLRKYKDAAVTARAAFDLDQEES